MKTITRMKTPDLAAAALREGILSGEWADRLPGTRILAKRLAVSPPTVAAALERLAAEGLLTRPGERHAYRITKPHVRKAAARGTKTKRLLILTPEEPAALVETTRRILETVRDRMQAKGWLVDSQVVDFLHVKHAQKQWDRIIQTDRGTRVIAVYGRPPLAEWAIRRKVRMFFLGGFTDGLPIPMAAVSSPRLLESALARLAALGH
jgi:DNA-binding GntR family transcriptional regulator